MIILTTQQSKRIQSKFNLLDEGDSNDGSAYMQQMA